LAKARTPEMEDIAGFRVPAANRNTESRGLWLEQPVQGGDRCVVVSIDGGGQQGEASIRVHAPSWKTKLRHWQVNEYYLNCAEMVLSCVSETES
jgi:hypothetical protein